MRSPRETRCLRVVLGLYAAVLLVAGVFWEDTCFILYFATIEWIETLQRLLSTRALPSWNSLDVVSNGYFGFMATSGMLALQFVFHAIGWGVRLPGHWLWSCTGAHAALVIAWWLWAVVTASPDIETADWFRWILPIFAIAITKLTCAILVLSEKRSQPDAS